ncbi:MAG: AI-2E family transporter, partial [Oscillospiraceae bacterium]
MHKRVKDYLTNSTISNIVTVSVGVLLFLAVSNFSVVRSSWDRYVGILSPFICAFALAYVLNNPVSWFERKVFYSFKKKKALSITLVYLIVLGILCGLFTAVIPQLVQSLISVANALPEYLSSLSDAANRLTQLYHIDPQIAIELENLWTNIVKAATEFALGIIPQVLNLSVSVGNMVVKALMVLVASVYMLLGKSRLTFQIKKMVYAYFKGTQADRLVEIVRRSNTIFAGFISGKILDSFIIGVICFAGMLFIFSPYATLIAVIVGVTNMIPFFGPFIGAIPCVFILLMVGGPKVAFVFTIFIIILQQLDGN